LENAISKSGAAKDFSMASAHCDTFDACLSKPTLPQFKAGAAIEHLPERKIPRHHAEHSRAVDTRRNFQRIGCARFLLEKSSTVSA